MATERRNHAAREIHRSNLFRRTMARQRQGHLQISTSPRQTSHARRTAQDHESSGCSNWMEQRSIRQQTHQTRIHRKRLPTTQPMERTRPNARSQRSIQIPIQQTRLRSTKTRRRSQSPTLRIPTLVRLHGRQQQSLARNEAISNPRRQPTRRPIRHPAAMDQQPPTRSSCRRQPRRMPKLRLNPHHQSRKKIPKRRRIPKTPMRKLRFLHDRGKTSRRNLQITIR